MVAAGELGAIRLVTGHDHQDWLARETGWNRRLTVEAGGALRPAGDSGTHWLDLTSLIAGMAPSDVFADLAAFLPERQRPAGPVETSARAAGATERRHPGTSHIDVATLPTPRRARSSAPRRRGDSPSRAWAVIRAPSTPRRRSGSG